MFSAPTSALLGRNVKLSFSVLLLLPHKSPYSSWFLQLLRVRSRTFFFSAFRGAAHPSLPPFMSLHTLFTATVPWFDCALSTTFAALTLRMFVFSLWCPNFSPPYLPLTHVPHDLSLARATTRRFLPNRRTATAGQLPPGWGPFSSPALLGRYGKSFGLDYAALSWAVVQVLGYTFHLVYQKKKKPTLTFAHCLHFASGLGEVCPKVMERST